MEPRSFKCLLQLNKRTRCDLIAEGLDHIAEHVEVLREDVLRLDELGRRRSATILSLTADEEAAKALMLLDIFRSNEDQCVVRRQLNRVGSHLARCIYAYVARRRPISFADLRARVGRARRSHYLDGPMDADWISSNELLAEREGAIYVDFVWDLESANGTWMTPAQYDNIGFGGSDTAVPELVLSLKRTGCLSRRALDLIAQAWKGFELRDDADCFQVQDITIDLVNGIHDEGLFLDTATQEDVDRVVTYWGFPLIELELSPLKVTRDQLRSQQQSILADWTY